MRAPWPGARVRKGESCLADAHPVGHVQGPYRDLRGCVAAATMRGMVIALLVVAAIAAIWWLVDHKGWGTVQGAVFWVVVVVVVWVVVTRYSAPVPGG
jgi:hypothetical protein